MFKSENTMCFFEKINVFIRKNPKKAVLFLCRELCRRFFVLHVLHSQPSQGINKGRRVYVCPKSNLNNFVHPATILRGSHVPSLFERRSI